MTENNGMDPIDLDLKEGQRVGRLMELEVRKHTPSIEARIYAVVATVAFNCATMAQSEEDAFTLLEMIMEKARSAIPPIFQMSGGVRLTRSSSILEPGRRETTKTVDGISLHVVKAGRAGDPLLVLMHGFPEFWWA
jgi:hypothetical protein